MIGDLKVEHDSQQPNPPARRWISIVTFTLSALAAAFLFFYRVQTYHFAEVQRTFYIETATAACANSKPPCEKAHTHTVVMAQRRPGITKRPFASELQYSQRPTRSM